MTILALRNACFAIALSLATGFGLMPQTAYSQDWAANDQSIDARRAERYQQLVDQSPEESYAFNQLMQSVGKGGTAYEKLIKSYEQKVEKKPNNYNLRMVLGHMYRYGGRLDQAMHAYREAEKLNSTALVAMSIAKIEAESRNYVEATNAYERALSLSSSKDQKIEILRAMAEIAIARRDLARAKDCFSQLIALDDSVFLRRELSQVYAQNNMFDEARNVLKEAKNSRAISADEKYRLDLDIATLWEQDNNDEQAKRVYDELEAKLPASHWMKRELITRQIDIARRQGDVSSLVSTLEKQWKNPSLEQRLELAQLYDEVGRTNDAETQYKKAISSKSDNAEAREKYITFLKSHGRIEDANKARTERLKVKSLSTNFEYHYELYEAYIQQKRLDDALKVLDNARNVFKSDFDVLQRIAQAYMLHGRDAKALDIFTAEVNAHPSDMNAIEALGDFYDTQGQKKLALETWQKIERISSVDKTTRLESLARIYDEHGYPTEALSLYERVTKENPDDCTMLRCYADALSRNRLFEQSVEAYENLSDKCKNEAITRTAAKSVAQIQENRGNVERALNRAITRAQATPGDPARTRFAALLALALDRPTDALKTVENYTAAHPQDADMAQTLVTLYEAARLNDKARSKLESLTAQSSPDARRTALIALAEFDEARGDLVKARENLSQALEIDANDADTNEKMGDLLTRQRQYADAANYYQIASQINNANASYAFKHATSLSMIGQDDVADDIYIKIVSSSNDESLIRRAAERSIDYHAWKNNLEKLENTWKALLYSTQRRDLYVGIMLKIAQLQAQPHILAIKTQSPRSAIANRHALRDLAERHARAIIEGLQSKDTALAAQALNAAQWFANASVIEMLINQFDTTSSNTLGRQQQLDAVRAMAHAQLPAAVSALANFYKNSTLSRSLREHALWALGLIPSSESRKILHNALNDPLDSFRELAILGLVRQGEKSPKFDELAKSDPSRNVQNVAAWALAASQSPELDAVVKNLQPSYESDAFPDTLAKATQDNKTNDVYHPYQLWMLSRVKNEKTAQRLLEVSWIVGGELRTVAAELICADADSPDLSALTMFEAQGRFFGNSEGFYASRVELEALLDSAVLTNAYQKHAKSWFEAHPVALKNAITRVLTGSGKSYDAALTRLSDDLTRANSPFADALSSPDVRNVIRDALSSLRPSLINWLDACQDACPSDNASEKAAAALRLASAYDLGLSQKIVDLASQSSDRKMQFEAIKALSLSSDTLARQALCSLANHDDWLVRATAVESLNPANAQERDALNNALNDPYAIVRDAALKRLNN